MKKLVSLLLAALLLCSLAACGSSKKSFEEDLATLVQGNLDELYKGQFSEDYLKLLGATEDARRQVYEDNLNTNAEYFARSYDIVYLTDEIRSQLIDFYRELYSHASYTVGEVSQLDDNTYMVSVQIQPMDLFQQMDQAWEEWMAPFYAAHSSVDWNALSESDSKSLDAEWAGYVLGLAQEKLAGLGYLEAENLAVQVTKNEDGAWSISENDIYTIDELIIAPVAEE